MTQRIFITGDSWGCGEWHPHKKILLHKGIEQYLLDNQCAVYNSSKHNGSNSEAIHNLENNLKNYSSPGDIVLFVQSDPLRNCDPFIESQNSFRFYNLKPSLEIHRSLKNIMSVCLDEDYQKLNHLGTKFNVVVNLIGGHSSVNVELAKKYKSLNLLVKSWAELLVGNKFPDVDFDNFNVWGNLALDTTLISDFLTRNEPLPLDPAISRVLVEELHTFHTNKKVFDDPLFHPDGIHPNREGHKILFNYIKEKI